MKKILLVSGLLLGIAGCTPTAQDGPNVVNEALALSYQDAIVKGDIATLTEILADNFVQLGPGVGDSVKRGAMLVEWKKSWEEEFSSMSYDRYALLSKTVKEGRVAGDWALDWGKLTMNYKNGKPSVTVWYHSAVRIRNGKIERQRIFMDVADLLTQRGFVFTPPTETLQK